jgi:predicted dehydrogenase
MADVEQGGAPGRRYAVVGTGHRAEMYVAALLGSHAAAGELVALCDPNPARIAYYRDLVRRARPGAPELPAYPPGRFAELVDRERPDVVVVTTLDRLHAPYVVQALELGCAVVVEKPLTVDADGCRRIVDAVARTGGNVVVTFNYRYSPRNSAVKRLLVDGAVGQVTSVHFEWVLDTVHGADYFRRWHRDKEDSGGLLVHKSGHHFDLVNWWLDDVPDVVHAEGALQFYGAENAPANSDDAAAFGLDLAADDRLRRLYLEAEAHDGYVRNRDVFDAGITIEDNLAVLARYRRGALLTYSLNAHAPWEGYRVAVNGTEGRLELDVVERAAVRPSRSGTPVDPSVTPDVGVRGGEMSDGGHGDGVAAAAARRPGNRLVLQRHWEASREVDVDALAREDPGRPPRGGGHGGGDLLLLDDVLLGPEHSGPDPLGRAAGYLDGVRSVLVGAAANLAMRTGAPVRVADLGVPLDAPAPQPAASGAREGA